MNDKVETAEGDYNIGGWTPKKVTGILAVGVIVLVTGYIFKDDIADFFAAQQRNESSALQTKANKDAISSLSKELKASIASLARETHSEHRELSDAVNLMKGNLRSVTEAQKQAKVERDKNTVFAAVQPTRGTRRTERLDNLDKEYERQNAILEKMRDQHSIPGRHPMNH